MLYLSCYKSLSFILCTFDIFEVFFILYIFTPIKFFFMKEQNLLLLAITIVMVKFRTTSEEIMKCALRVEK